MRILLFIVVNLLTALSFAHGLTPDTLVSTPTGMAPIASLFVGDAVQSCDFTNRCTLQPVLARRDNHVDGYYEIRTGNDVIKASPSQPFFVHGNGWIQAKSLRPHHQLQNQDYEPIGIFSIRYIQEPTDLIVISVDQDHNFFVGNDHILVHNFVSIIPLGVGAWQAITAAFAIGGATLLADQVGGQVRDIVHQIATNPAFDAGNMLPEIKKQLLAAKAELFEKAFNIESDEKIRQRVEYITGIKDWYGQTKAKEAYRKDMEAVGQQFAQAFNKASKRQLKIQELQAAVLTIVQNELKKKHPEKYANNGQTPIEGQSLIDDSDPNQFKSLVKDAEINTIVTRAVHDTKEFVGASELTRDQIRQIILTFIYAATKGAATGNAFNAIKFGLQAATLEWVRVNGIDGIEEMINNRLSVNLREALDRLTQNVITRNNFEGIIGRVYQYDLTNNNKDNNHRLRDHFVNLSGESVKRIGDALASFESGKFEHKEAKDTFPVYRIYGKGGGTGGVKPRYYSRHLPISSSFSKQELALLDEFGNPATHYIKVEIYPGTQFLEGKVAPQKRGNQDLPGGASQIFIVSPENKIYTYSDIKDEKPLPQ